MGSSSSARSRQGECPSGTPMLIRDGNTPAVEWGPPGPTASARQWLTTIRLGARLANNRRRTPNRQYMQFRGGDCLCRYADWSQLHRQMSLGYLFAHPKTANLLKGRDPSSVRVGSPTHCLEGTLGRPSLSVEGAPLGTGSKARVLVRSAWSGRVGGTRVVPDKTAALPKMGPRR